MGVGNITSIDKPIPVSVLVHTGILEPNWRPEFCNWESKQILVKCITFRITTGDSRKQKVNTKPYVMRGNIEG